jgi:tetratricopeptide (TPR) repeat protein
MIGDRGALCLLLAACAVGHARGAPGCQTMAAGNRADIPALANTGLELSRQQHYKEAADCYRKALSIESNIREIQLNLGLAEFKLGDFQAALGPLSAVLAADPGNVQARTLLGMSYYGAGMYAKAVPELDRALTGDPENTQLHHVIAQSCLWSGQHQRALQEFEWLLRKQPDSAATHMLMGEALDGLGRDPEAIGEFQAAAAAAPKEPEVHFGLGYLFWKERRYDEAESEFRRELTNDPSHAQANAYLGDVLLHRDDPEAAGPLLEKASRLDAKIRIVHLDLGIIFAGRKEYGPAERELREAVRLDPSKADAHYRLAQVYQSLGRTAEAKAERAVVTGLHEKRNEDLLEQISGRRLE